MKKYLVWNIYPLKYKSFNTLKEAKKYCNKQKTEACINIEINGINEDTIYCNGKFNNKNEKEINNNE